MRGGRPGDRRIGPALVGVIVAAVVGCAPLLLVPTTSAAASAGVVAGQPVAFGTAGSYGSAPAGGLVAPVVAMTATPSGHGYWMAAADGGVFAFGDASFFGSTGAQRLNRPVVGMAATPSGKGYWLVASDGGIFAFGDASFFGSTGAQHLNRPVVGMAATPSGTGYWLVASDGGIFAFGDASFFGSTGAQHLNRPVVGMAATPSGTGYWLVASDGGIFAFGDAPFLGSMGGQPLNRPVVGMAATPSGTGYWLAASDGGIFNFGDAPFLGSMGGQPIADPIGAIVATPDGQGLWLLPVPPGRVGGPNLAGVVISNLSDIPGNVYPKGTKVAALTFDDGPSPVYTPQILQVLTAADVPATFQIIGELGAAWPNLLAQEAADGMTLTNHTWTHTDLTRLSPAGWPGEVDRTTNMITSVTGQPVKCLRPPYGNTDASVLSRLARRSLGELMWDVDPSDYLRPGTAVIVNRVLSALHPGAIIALHDGGGDRSQTVAALPAIIGGIRAAGYTLVSVCN